MGDGGMERAFTQFILLLKYSVLHELVLPVFFLTEMHVMQFVPDGAGISIAGGQVVADRVDGRVPWKVQGVVSSYLLL